MRPIWKVNLQKFAAFPPIANDKIEQIARQLFKVLEIA